MDVSSLPEEAALGARFYDEGKEGDALEILKKYGANSLRIRLWNDPYSEDGKPYSAGTSDFTKLVALASAGKSWATAICWICITVILGRSRQTVPSQGVGVCRCGCTGEACV